jgi:hypothetical protein
MALFQGCANGLSKAGDVCIWDRKKGALLHTFEPKTPNSMSSVYGVSWNRGLSHAPMFAITDSQSVTIWGSQISSVPLSDDPVSFPTPQRSHTLSALPPFPDPELDSASGANLSRHRDTD